jgi:UDP-galactopyranose mutase
LANELRIGCRIAQRAIDVVDDKPIILGAGLTGLAASIETGAPIYEASGEVGGASGADRIDGFAFDRGIHVLQTENKTIERLFDDVGLRFVSRVRSAHIFSHGVFTAYPFQVNTAGLPLRLRARCVGGYLRRGRGRAPLNYEDWIYHTIGRGFGDTFLIPYSEKFWTVHPREMVSNWTRNRVPATSIWQVLRGSIWNKRTDAGTNARFRYPENESGFAAIPEALSKRAGKIHLKQRATRVDPENKRIRFDGGLEVGYDHLISTIPLPELVCMIPQAPADMREAASKLRANRIIVVNLGIGRPDVSDKHWVHFPEKHISFFRISFPHNFTRKVVPDGASAISAEVACTEGTSIDQASVAERVLEDLVRVGILQRDDPIIARETAEVKYGYCIFDKERRPAVRKLRAWLESLNITTAGRYGLWAYFWSHEAILNGLNTGRTVKRRMNARASAAMRRVPGTGGLIALGGNEVS